MWTRRSLQQDITACIDALPPQVNAASIGGAWVVIGPTGVFAVMAHDGSADRARAISRLAATVRSALAERMAWVPFVHALLVGERSATTGSAAIVPPDLLTEVLTEGRRTIEPETQVTLLRLLDEGVLNGLEAVAPAVDDGNMDGCTSNFAPATMSRSPYTHSDPTGEEHTSSWPTPRASTPGSGSRSPNV